MKAYRTYLTVTDPGQVVLKNVPFGSGERVEVLLLSHNEGDAARVREFESLLKTTHELPHIRALTDDEVAAEVAAHRSGR